MDAVLQSKWDRLKAGSEVITNDAELDKMTAYFNDNDGPDADLYFRNLASKPNPNRCGVLDQYVAFITR